MSLRDELKAVSGRKKRFLLLRIIDVSPEEARRLCGINRGTYNSWLQVEAFVALHRRRDELSVEYKQEALQMMRRDNQLQAVLLEEKIIEKMKAEIESGVYDLIRSNLAREVYSKLIADLDYQPASLSLTWEQKIALLNQPTEPAQLPEGGVIDGEVIEATGIQPSEHQESGTIPESEQASDETKKKAQES